MNAKNPRRAPHPDLEDDGERRSAPHRGALKGRGAASQPAVRFDANRVEPSDDGWDSLAQLDVPESIATELRPEVARSLITRNDSPDIAFEQSINPYRGCEHGCVYCYARPSHAYVGLSPGLDFETKIYFKQGAVKLLEAELAKPGYVPRTIMLGANTDPYQPAERRLRVTRGVLEVMARTRHPVCIVTKGALVLRDLDLLADLARDRLTQVTISLPTLRDDLKRTLEPRAASPRARLAIIEKLARAGVPVGVLVAPIIPILTDPEMEAVLEAVAAAGASAAMYVLLRLPHEVAPLFRQWLSLHAPDQAAHVMARVRDMRAGRDNDPCFGTRMTGQGAYADLIRQRFHLAARRLGLATRDRLALDTQQFVRPSGPGGAGQLALDW
jgi:DNA repair photolyase